MEEVMPAEKDLSLVDFEDLETQDHKETNSFYREFFGGIGIAAVAVVAAIIAGIGLAIKLMT